jgi:hypothetical protein
VLISVAKTMLRKLCDCSQSTIALIIFCRPNRKYQVTSNDEENELPRPKKHKDDVTSVSKKVAEHPAVEKRVKKLPLPPKPLSLKNKPVVLTVVLDEQSILD